MGLSSITEKGSLVLWLAFLIETMKDEFIDFNRTIEESTSVTEEFVRDSELNPNICWCY